MNMLSKSEAPTGDLRYTFDWENSSLDGKILAFIDARTLTRECFVRAIGLQQPGLKVLAFASVAEWDQATARGARADIVFYNIGASHPSERPVGAELRRLVAEAAPAPVVVLADSDGLDVMLESFRCGVRGCVPESVGIDSLLQVTRLTLLGGVFLPASAMTALCRGVEPRPVPVPEAGQPALTARQAAVAEALRHGKSNKIIAYELNMCENTVKVHIRNILKKLHATNRTEAAFRLNSAAHGGESQPS